MRKHYHILLAGLLLSACATDDVSQTPNVIAPVAKRADKGNAPVSAPVKARSSTPVQTSPSVPLDNIVIQHRNRDKANLIAALGGGVERGSADTYMTQNVEELQRVLQHEMGQGVVRIDRRASDDAIRVSMTPSSGFDNLSSVVKPGFLASLSKVVPVLNEYGKTMLTVIGYVEYVGPDAGNLKLAERRAKSVADYLRIQNVHALRLQSYARNDSPSRGDPTKGSGKPMRRVELWIQPVLAP